MSTYDVFLSHAPADAMAAADLRRWLNAAQVSVCPVEGNRVSQARTFLLLLSVRWLLDEAVQQQLALTQQAGTGLVVVVTPDVAREGADSTSRGRQAELQQLLSGHPAEVLLRSQDWHWPREQLGRALSWDVLLPLLRPNLATWPARHARLTERSERWKAQSDPSLLLRGDELVRELREALLGDPARQPALDRELLGFLLESQRAELADAQRLSGLCWGAQAQAAALASQEHAAFQPDLALALAAAATEVADVPQTRHTLLNLMARYPGLQRIFQNHAPGRPVLSLAFSPDGLWLASADTRSRSQPDDTRPARLNLIHLETLTVREAIQTRAGQIGSLAWGRPWLAVGARGSISWVRWDDAERRFGSRSPRTLNEQVLPMWMSWSGPNGPGGSDWLVWGSLEGIIGLSRPGTGPEVRHHEFRLRNAGQREALQGLAWLTPDRLITVERNEILLRPLPTLEPPVSLGTVDQVHHLQVANGHWVVSCTQRGKPGVLRGYLDQAKGFEPLSDAFNTPFTGLDLCLGMPVTDPYWVVSPRVLSQLQTTKFSQHPGRVSTPAISAGRFSQELLPMLASTAAQPASLVADPLRRRVAMGDESSGRVWLWELGALHPLLKPSLPTGTTDQMCIGTEDLALWVDTQGNVHVGVADAGQKPNRLNVGFKAAFMHSMNNGRSALLLGQRCESISLDLVENQTRPVQWPQPLQRDTLHLVACADRAPRTAFVDGSGWLWLLEGEPHAWRSIGQWQVPGQALAVALSPLGDQIYVQVAQGFFRIGRWTVGVTDEEPDWVMVLRNGKPGPMALHEDGSLVVGDSHDLYRVPPSAPAEPAVLLPGHSTPISHVATRDNLTLSVAGRDQYALVEDLWLWGPEGQLLGTMELPEKLDSLKISRGGRFAWLRTVSGAMWRLPLRSDGWARQAIAMAGRELNPTERRLYGLANAAHHMPARMGAVPPIRKSPAP